MKCNLLNIKVILRCKHEPDILNTKGWNAKKLSRAEVEYKPCEISCYNIYTVYQNLWRAGEYCRLSVLILEFMTKGQKIIKKHTFFQIMLF